MYRESALYQGFWRWIIFYNYPKTTVTYIRGLYLISAICKKLLDNGERVRYYKDRKTFQR